MSHDPCDAVARSISALSCFCLLPTCSLCLPWQVNGIPLIGETHKEVVNILKELPVHVCVVGSRIVAPTLPDSDDEYEDDARLSLKELLAEFNDKVDSQMDGFREGREGGT